MVHLKATGKALPADLGPPCKFGTIYPKLLLVWSLELGLQGLGARVEGVSLGCRRGDLNRSHMQPLMIHKLGFNQNYYTLTLILLIKIVPRSRLP